MAVRGDGTKAMKSGFGLTLDSNKQVVLTEFSIVLGNRSFMQPNAQAFDQAPLFDAYGEEEKFIMNVKCVPWQSVPKSPNLI